MAGTTETKTKIKVGLDASEIKKGGETIREAFNPKTVEGFRRQTTHLERDLSRLVKKQGELAEKLADVEQGSEAYKKLRVELKGVKDQAELVNTALTQMDRIQSRANRQQQDKSKGTARSFAAGMGQGTGLGQYIPTEQGMGARMVGQAVGGGLRRAGGMAAAPFMTPGISGLAGALGQLPFGLGAFGGAALNSASSSYQAAVGYDRSKLGNLHFAGESTKTDLGIDKEGLRSARKDQQAAKGAVKGARSSHNAVARRLRNQSTVSESEWEELAEHRADVAAKQAKVDEAKAAVATAKTKHKFKREGGLGSTSMGTELGFNPNEVQGLLSSFFGARGGEMDKDGERQARTALTAQRAYGVDMGASGSFQRGAMAGGGGTGDQQLSSVLQGAVAAGLRGSQVPEFLGTLVDLQQRAEKQGLKIDAQEFVKTTMMMNWGGMKGLQGQRMAGELTQSAQSLSQRGVQSAEDVMMLRAAGYDPAGGMTSLEDSMLALENPSQEVLQKIMGKLVEGSGGAGTPGAKLHLSHALGRMGVKAGLQQSGEMLEAYKSGGNVDVFTQLMEQKAGGGDKAMRDKAKAGVSQHAPTAAGAARLDAQRINVGKGLGPAMQGFERNMIQAGTVAKNFAGDMKVLNGVVSGAIDMVNQFTKGGTGGTFDRIVKLLEKVLGFASGVPLPP